MCLPDHEHVVLSVSQPAKKKKKKKGQKKTKKTPKKQELRKWHIIRPFAKTECILCVWQKDGQADKQEQQLCN